jgi:hypothetical protein
MLRAAGAPADVVAGVAAREDNTARSILEYLLPKPPSSTDEQPPEKQA